jgi:hypothetical protein
MLRSFVVHVLDLESEQFCGNIPSTGVLLGVSTTITSHFQLARLFHTYSRIHPFASTLVIGDGCKVSMCHLSRCPPH